MKFLEHRPQGPFNLLFGDVYFSQEDGLGETREVFLKGCGLPEAWRGRGTFRIGELGFGSGLNILALGQLWRQTPGAPALDVWSVEQAPWTREDFLQAHGHREEIAADLHHLAQTYDPRVPLWRGTFPWGTLQVVHGPAAQALDAFPFPVDAWFLDGFSPAVNPDIWAEDLLVKIFEKSQSGTRGATFSAAGLVKSGLRNVGFRVVRRPGYGSKRHRLEFFKD